jgi:hypothetical protein
MAAMLAGKRVEESAELWVDRTVVILVDMLEVQLAEEMVGTMGVR